MVEAFILGAASSLAVFCASAALRILKKRKWKLRPVWAFPMLEEEKEALADTLAALEGLYGYYSGLDKSDLAFLRRFVKLIDDRRNWRWVV
jgi:hypothetical protein